MSTLSVNVRYRPVRIGFCLRRDSLEDLDRALRLTNTFWGGRFNPLIPIGLNEEENKLARALVNVFGLDVLHGISPSPAIENFIASFPYLPWPRFKRDLYVGAPGHRVASFIDIYHPARTLFEEHVKDKPEPRVSSTLYQWEQTDPLRHVLLATFGAYPDQGEIGKDYSSFFVDNLRGKRIVIGEPDALPADSYKALTPFALSALGLDWVGFSARGDPGFYVGNSEAFDDLVNFWNLRAANIDLLFHDPAYAPRFAPLKDAYLGELLKRPSDPRGWLHRVALWSRSEDFPEGRNFGPDVVWSVIRDEGIWNGLNVKPPRVYISEQSALASVSDSETPPSLSFQLPRKEFFDDREFYHQSVVVSVSPIGDLFGREDFTFRLPNIPELNEYYGRAAHLIRPEVRSEPEGLGIITNLTRDNLTVRAVPTRELITQIFLAFGMRAEPSQPGLVASRLIKQMGGVQGCRVFKIAGVRALIERYGPLKSFTRSGAVQIIGQNDPATGRPDFAPFENLFIEQRDDPKLTPEQAFKYLVRNGVFRAGLNLKCPHCQLDFWVALDDIGRTLSANCAAILLISPGSCMTETGLIDVLASSEERTIKRAASRLRSRFSRWTPPYLTG